VRGGAGMKFKTGGIVRWTSQSQATKTTKIGMVVRVLAQWQLPPAEYKSLHAKTKYSLGRNHESYVVQVGNQYYWPLVVHLKAVMR